MFWIIFSAIIYLIANRFLDKDRYDIFDTILFGIMELIIGALIGIVLYIAIGYFISPYFPSKCITTKQELYSFDNSNDYYLMIDIPTGKPMRILFMQDLLLCLQWFAKQPLPY